MGWRKCYVWGKILFGNFIFNLFTMKYICASYACDKLGHEISIGVNFGGKYYAANLNRLYSSTNIIQMKQNKISITLKLYFVHKIRN